MGFTIVQTRRLLRLILASTKWYMEAGRPEIEGC
jgi:hypothetical protein